MLFDYQIYLLSKQFSKSYPLSDYPELMYKEGRPYNCLLIDTHEDYLICVPYRTNISHNNAFHFKRSKRSKENRSGLDYSKIVIINDLTLISSEKAVIDHDEYLETVQNIDRIAKDVSQYIDTYILHVKGKKILSSNGYERKYKYSTLKYFHNELGINMQD